VYGLAISTFYITVLVPAVVVLLSPTAHSLDQLWFSCPDVKHPARIVTASSSFNVKHENVKMIRLWTQLICADRQKNDNIAKKIPKTTWVS
jgi:hypothetical protein